MSCLGMGECCWFEDTKLQVDKRNGLLDVLRSSKEMTVVDNNVF